MVKKPKVVDTSWKNTSEFYAPHPYFCELIVGAGDTGKTTYLKRIVEIEHKYYDQIVMIGPHVLDEKYGLHDIVESTGKVVKIYLDFTKDAIIDKFYKFIDSSAKQGLNTLIIVDDPIGMTHFCKNINQKSRWNTLMSTKKHKRVGIKFAVQGDGGMSAFGRGMCERITKFPDYGNLDNMYEWCQFLPTAKIQKEFILSRQKPYNAISFCRFRGMKGIFLINDNMIVSPVTSL